MMRRSVSSMCAKWIGLSYRLARTVQVMSVIFILAPLSGIRDDAKLPKRNVLRLVFPSRTAARVVIQGIIRDSRRHQNKVRIALPRFEIHYLIVPPLWKGDDCVAKGKIRPFAINLRSLT